MITNPFTGQVLNWTDEARRKSAESRRRRAGRSYDKSKNLIRREFKKLGGTLEFYEDDPGGISGYVQKGVNLQTGQKAVRAGVSKGRFERELAMHELGHAFTEPDNPPTVYKDEASRVKAMLGAMSNRSESGEDAAWQWALKNAGRFNISKRKLRRIKRNAEYLDSLDGY